MLCLYIYLELRLRWLRCYVQDKNSPLQVHRKTTASLPRYVHYRSRVIIFTVARTPLPQIAVCATNPKKRRPWQWQRGAGKLFLIVNNFLLILSNVLFFTVLYILSHRNPVSVSVSKKYWTTGNAAFVSLDKNPVSLCARNSKILRHLVADGKKGL